MSSAGAGSPLDLAAIAHHSHMYLDNEARDTIAALLTVLRATRQALGRAHDFIVLNERRALQSPTDTVTLTGQILQAARRDAAAVLAQAVEGG